VDRFIQHCASGNVPMDFVPTHVYSNDTAKDVFSTDENIPRDKIVYPTFKKVHDHVKASAKPDLPVIFSEYNAAYDNEVDVTDSAFMGPWLANTIRQCDGLTEIMSYWAFSDVLEEHGVVKRPFYGGFGLMAVGNIRKVAYNDFKLPHELGTERIRVDSDSAFATRRPDGSLAIALWNYVLPGNGGASGKSHFRSTDLLGRLKPTFRLSIASMAQLLRRGRRWASRIFPAASSTRPFARLRSLARRKFVLWLRPTPPRFR
jgi:xylan 1,4-beta-xylosidase